MSNKQTQLQATDRDGKMVSVQHTSTDMPILPAENIAKLYSIDPQIVTFVMEQTKAEAEARRAESTRINRFVFMERISGVVMGGIVALAAFLIGAYVILQGHDVAGVSLCGVSLVGIVSVIVTRQSGKNGKGEPPKPPPKARTAKR